MKRPLDEIRRMDRSPKRSRFQELLKGRTDGTYVCDCPDCSSGKLYSYSLDGNEAAKFFPTYPGRAGMSKRILSAVVCTTIGCAD